MDLAKIRKKAKGSAPSTEARPALVEPVAVTAAAVPEPAAPHAPETPPPPAPEREMRSAPDRRPGPDGDSFQPIPPGVAAPPQAPAPSAEPAPGESGHVEKLLVFTVGRRRYAIPIHDISQIIEEHPVTPVPHAPPFLLGIFSLRGRIVSVFDAGLRLGVQDPGEETAAKVVVLDVGEELFGIRVHGIDTVTEVDLETLEPPPDSFRTQDQEFVEGVFHHRERTVSFLNLPLFLAYTPGGESA